LNTETKQYLSLAETTAWRYQRCGRFVHCFVRGKLLHDPVYQAILNLDILPEQGRIVDLGCGRGILLALLTTARHLQYCVTPPLDFQGMELRQKDAAIARDTLALDATILNADIRTEAIPACQVAFLLDVLLYMDKAAQEALLQRVAQALQPKGILIIREADASAGFRYLVTWLGERFCALGRGHWRQQYFYRRQQDWATLLAALGFKVETYPMSQGTPFANVLFVAQRN
jgi:SAM-dependent methyltransferase